MFLSVCRSVCFCLSVGWSVFVCLQVSLFSSVCGSVCFCPSVGQSVLGQSVFVCLWVSLSSCTTSVRKTGFVSKDFSQEQWLCVKRLELGTAALCRRKTSVRNSGFVSEKDQLGTVALCQKTSVRNSGFVSEKDFS